MDKMSEKLKPDLNGGWCVAITENGCSQRERPNWSWMEVERRNTRTLLLRKETPRTKLITARINRLAAFVHYPT